VRLLVIGAGGHAKVVTDTAMTAGWEIAGVIGERGGRRELLGHRVTYDVGAIDADAFIVAIGDNRKRADLFDEYRFGGLQPARVVHPSAIIGTNVELGAGVFVSAGAIINVDTVIGDNAIINTGCIVEHDCNIGPHTLIGPNASLCGGCTVGDGTLVGAGVSVAPMRSIGAWSVVGAGAAVVDDLPAHSVCVGVPARPLERTPETRAAETRGKE